VEMVEMQSRREASSPRAPRILPFAAGSLAE
jgi:hypothetical protein